MAKSAARTTTLSALATAGGMLASALNIFLLATLLLLSLPSHAKWIEASSRHFVVYSEGTPESARNLAERLERFDQALRFLQDLSDGETSPANRLTIYLLRTEVRVKKLVGGNFIGFYFARAGASVAFAPESFLIRDLDADAVLFHVYALHFLNGNFSIGWPAWLSAGFAEFYSTAQIESEGAMKVGLPAQLRSNTLLYEAYRIPVAEMMSLALTAPRSEISSMAARSWLLVHYLSFDPSRKGQLRAYLAGLAQGTPSVTAAEAAFGDLKKLDRDMNQYLGRNKFAAVTVPASAIKADAITVREASAGENAIMSLKIKSQRGLNAQQAAELVPLMRAAAEPFANDAAVQTALSKVEFDAANFEAAQAAADRALAVDSNHIDALLYKGRSLAALAGKAGTRDAAAWREVRRWFLTANRLDPEDPRPLIHFYKSFAASGEAPTANAVAGLNYALELARQDSDLRTIVMRQALLDGDAAKARRLLVLMVSDAEAGAAGTQAAALIEKLDQEGAAAALEAFQELEDVDTTAR